MRASLAASRADAHDARLLHGVAGSAWRQLALWPVPALRHQVVTTSVGEAVRLKLALAPAAPAGALWSDATGLPPGVTLSPTGVLGGHAHQVWHVHRGVPDPWHRPRDERSLRARS